MLHVPLEVRAAAVIHDEPERPVEFVATAEPDDVRVVERAEALDLPEQLGGSSRIRIQRNRYLLHLSQDATPVFFRQIRSLRLATSKLLVHIKEVFPLELIFGAQAAVFGAQRLPEEAVHGVQDLPEDRREGFGAELQGRCGRQPLTRLPVAEVLEALGRALRHPAVLLAQSSPTAILLCSSHDELVGAAAYSDAFVDVLTHGVEPRMRQHGPPLTPFGVLVEQPVRLELHTAIPHHFCDPCEVLP
mmetsp:Transcript_138952/g.432289  ORF Transcript_138952/g.432289 Transcript_138952/m.432289 type:complete len:246 (-) Transcript_138952:359-1096(-)